jgi:hypothetical protein
MNIWLTIRGFVAGAVALIACPCHLPLTLPILLVLTAGTAVGGWLANNSMLIYSISVVLFIGGLLLAGKWLVVDKAEVCEIEQEVAELDDIGEILALREESVPPATKREPG